MEDVQEIERTSKREERKMGEEEGKGAGARHPKSTRFISAAPANEYTPTFPQHLRLVGRLFPATPTPLSWLHLYRLYSQHPRLVERNSRWTDLSWVAYAPNSDHRSPNFKFTSSLPSALPFLFRLCPVLNASDPISTLVETQAAAAMAAADSSLTPLSLLYSPLLLTPAWAFILGPYPGWRRHRKIDRCGSRSGGPRSGSPRRVGGPR